MFLSVSENQKVYVFIWLQCICFYFWLVEINCVYQSYCNKEFPNSKYHWDNPNVMEMLWYHQCTECMRGGEVSMESWLFYITSQCCQCAGIQLVFTCFPVVRTGEQCGTFWQLTYLAGWNSRAGEEEGRRSVTAVNEYIRNMESRIPDSETDEQIKCEWSHPGVGPCPSHLVLK